MSVRVGRWRSTPRGASVGTFVVDDTDIFLCGDSIFENEGEELGSAELDCLSAAISFVPEPALDVTFSTPATAGLFMLGLLGAGTAQRHKKANP